MEVNQAMLTWLLRQKKPNCDSIVIKVLLPVYLCFHLAPTVKGINEERNINPSTAAPPVAKNKTSLKYHLHNAQHFKQGMKCWMTMTTNPLDTLSVKLIAPYTKAEDSVLGPISSAVKDKLVIRTAEPAAPNIAAAKKIP